MKKKFTILFSLAFLPLFFWYNGMFAQSVKPGDAAPPFNLKNVDGQMVSLSSFSGEKGVIVVFTCNHCPFSKYYEDRIINLDRRLTTEGWKVVAINPNDPVQYPDDSFENMIKQAKKKKYGFPYLLDETQQVARAYGATRTPHFFIVQNTESGPVVKYIGAMDDNAEHADQVTEHYVENVIKALDAGKTPAVTETKAIGCGIKWKQQ